MNAPLMPIPPAIHQWLCDSALRLVRPDLTVTPDDHYRVGPKASILIKALATWRATPYPATLRLSTKRRGQCIIAEVVNDTFGGLLAGPSIIPDSAELTKAPDLAGRISAALKFMADTLKVNPSQLKIQLIPGPEPMFFFTRDNGEILALKGRVLTEFFNRARSGPWLAKREAPTSSGPPDAGGIWLASRTQAPVLLAPGSAFRDCLLSKSPSARLRGLFLAHTRYRGHDDVVGMFQFMDHPQFPDALILGEEESYQQPFSPATAVFRFLDPEQRVENQAIQSPRQWILHATSPRRLALR